MSLKWWEKTIEYQFVLLVAKERKLFVAPLDDAQERAGDTIFSTDRRWLLIEFKKDSTSIASEKRKFVSYSIADKALSSKDAHHYIIYGRETQEERPRLQLCSETYFSGRSFNLSGILSKGVEFDEFKEYLEQYTKFKKGPKGTSGGGGLQMSDFALVAGVTAEEGIVECLSLTEFQRQFGLELLHERTLSQGHDGPSL